MDSFTIKSAFAMGDPDPKYGQAWYTTVEEMDFPVMFNLMSGSVQELDKVTFETQEINRFKSGKNAGEEYRRLRKVKVIEASPRMVTPDKPQGNEVISDILKRLSALEETVERLSGKPKEDVIADVDDEPINLDDIPF